MSETSPKSRAGLVIWLILSQLLTLASLLFWLMVAGLSVMAFDSGVTTQAWTIVIAVWSYPLFPLALVIGAWVAFARRKNVLAAILSGISFLPPLVMFLIMVIGNMTYSLWAGG